MQISSQICQKLKVEDRISELKSLLKRKIRFGDILLKIKNDRIGKENFQKTPDEHYRTRKITCIIVNVNYCLTNFNYPSETIFA